MLFICTARPTPHESFSKAGSYRPMRFVGNVRGPARGLLPGTRAARAAASASAAAISFKVEDCPLIAPTTAFRVRGRGQRAPPALAV